jgi:GrpB-like predicted nucleotidyltransferase (UPF0157 family)
LNRYPFRKELTCKNIPKGAAMKETELGRLYPITIHPYNPHWPQWFAEEATQLSQLLGPRFSPIEHIGSTAVPGLAAKPTIDILVALPPDVDTSAVKSILTHHDYIYMLEQTPPCILKQLWQ